MTALRLLLAFGLGSLPTGWLLVKARSGEDVRATGSGGVGATNVARRLGWAAGSAVLLVDVAKGAAAVAAAGPDGAPAAVAAVCGHVWTPWLAFRGGKGVAVALGGFLVLVPAAALGALGAFAAALAGTRRVSAGSLAGAAALPLLCLAAGHRPGAAAAAAVLAVIAWAHRENVRRLAAGTEPTIRR